MRRKFVQINGELVEVSLNYQPISNPAVHGDIPRYRSQIDGSWIEGRAQHRAHLKKHGCVEVGNDLPQTFEPKGIPDVSPQKRKELIRSQVDAMSHREFKEAIKRDVDRVKWNSRTD